MSIKIFTLDKNNKISLTKEELEKLLNEAYWEGYWNNTNNNTTTITYPYNQPYYTWTNDTISINSNSTSTIPNTVSLNNSENITNSNKKE